MFKSRNNWGNELANIQDMSNKGMTFKAIAEHYGVSKQRLQQVFKKYKLDHVGLKLKQQMAERAWKRKWGNKVDTSLYDYQRAKYRGKKANALRAGIEFNIDFGDIVWNTHCPLLGIELDYFTEKRKENSCSFDRIDSNLGYVAGNVQVVSWRGNRIKNDGTAEEHMKIAKAMFSLQDCTT